MIQLTGRTALVTGGAQGIGLGIARNLAKQGVKVALVDIDAPALDAAGAELRAVTEVATYVLDVTDRDRFAVVADEVEAALGPVSLLFNNAGVAGVIPLTEMTYELWDWGLGINLGGVVNGIQTFLPRMVARGEGGHIVNTASGAGVAASASSGFLYCTAKYGVVGMSEALREELHLGRMGIGVSVLCPGPVATEIITRTLKSQPGSPGQMSENVESLHGVLAEGVTPDEVGEMVLQGIRTDSPFIFTDQVVSDAVIDRTEAMIAAMPTAAEEDENDEDDRGVGEGSTPTVFGDPKKRRKLKGSTVEAEIAASPAEVFGVVASPARAGEWSKGHKGYPDGTPDEIAPGVCFTQVIETAGSSTEIAWQVTQIESPHRFEMEGRGPLGIRLRTLIELEPANGGATRLTMTTEMGGGPLIGPVGKTARKNSEQNQRDSIEALKTLFARS